MDASLKSKLLLTFVVASSLFVVFNFNFIFNFFSQKIQGISFAEKVKTETPIPVRLQIPAIQIDAPIEYVGLTLEGAVDVPKNPSSAAWFELSSFPGEKGVSVIDGHSGYRNRKPAVFDNLYKLKKGDKVYVEDANGVVSVFVVRKLQSYDNKDSVSDVFVAKDSKSHLNLITCAGDWNEIEKTHSKRLVVFTDLLRE